MPGFGFTVGAEDSPSFGSFGSSFRETIQDDINGYNGTFQHRRIRLPCGETLHLHTRGAQDASSPGIGMSKPHQNFIADTCNNRQHSKMKEKTKEKIIDREYNIQYKKQQDTDDENDQKESGSATGMQTGKSLRIIGCKRET